MMEIFTIGGGEYLVNIFNAVSAWTGGGGFRALLRVVMFSDRPPPHDGFFVAPGRV